MKTEEDLLSYLDKLQSWHISTEMPTYKLINIARSYWLAFKCQAESYNRNLKVPYVWVEDNYVGFQWWVEKDYKTIFTDLVVEITEKDSSYFLYKNNKKLIWEKHYEPLQPPYGIPTDIYNKVLLFSEEIND